MMIIISVILTKFSVEMAIPDHNVMQWSHPCSLCWVYHQSHPKGLSWQLGQHHIGHKERAEGKYKQLQM